MSWAVAEFASATLIQFFVIRAIIHSKGAAQVGVWAVLMSAAQVAGLLDFGLSGGVSRYLARAVARKDLAEIEKILAIIVFLTIPFYIAMSLLVFAVMHMVIPEVIQRDFVPLAQNLVVYSTCAYFFLIISITMGSCLTGLHLGYRKSQIVITGVIVQGVLAWAWIDRLGLVGMAFAQIINNLIVIIGVVVMLKVAVKVRLRQLLQFDWPTAKEVLRFGAGLQLPSVAWSLYETSIRMLMSRFGGAMMLGQYEIAYRMAGQVRVLFFYVAQPLGPALVAKGNEGGEVFARFYDLIHARFSAFALLVAVGGIAMSPLVSWVMLGQLDPQYLFFAVLTAIGSAVHVWAMPCENAAVSQGVVRYNTIGTSSALLVMLFAGAPLGAMLGGYAVALSVVCASTLAAVIPVIWNSRHFHLPFWPDFRLAWADAARARSIGLELLAARRRAQ